MDLTLMHQMTSATRGLLVYVSDPSMATTTVLNAGLMLSKLHTTDPTPVATDAAVLPKGLAFCPTLLQQGRRTALAYIGSMPAAARCVDAEDPREVLFECMRARYAQGLMELFECAKSTASWKRKDLPMLLEQLAADVGRIVAHVGVVKLQWRPSRATPAVGACTHPASPASAASVRPL